MGLFNRDKKESSCSSSDEKGRACAWDLLKEKYSERLYNVGRLDMYTKGMIIFTNDGEFAAKLSHPSSQIEKEYIVETKNINSKRGFSMILVCKR